MRLADQGHAARETQRDPALVGVPTCPDQLQDETHCIFVRAPILADQGQLIAETQVWRALVGVPTSVNTYASNSPTRVKEASKPIIGSPWSALQPARTIEDTKPNRGSSGHPFSPRPKGT